MLQLAGRVSLAVHIADLLQLQATLQRQRIVKSPAHEEQIAAVHELAGQILNLIAVFQQRFLQRRGFLQLLGQISHLVLVQSTPGQCQPQRQQIHHRQLHTVCLGAGHCDLRPGVSVDCPVRCAGDGGTYHVDHRQCSGALFLRQLQGRQRIQRFAALADDDHQIPRMQNGVAVTEFTGNLGEGGQPGHLFNGGASHHTRVHGGAAAHDVNAGQPLQIFVGQTALAQIRQAVLDTGADGSL